MNVVRDKNESPTLSKKSKRRVRKGRFCVLVDKMVVLINLMRPLIRYSRGGLFYKSDSQLYGTFLLRKGFGALRFLVVRMGEGKREQY